MACAMKNVLTKLVTGEFVTMVALGDCVHPNWLGHLVFYRELAPYFGLPRHFPWE